MNPLPKLVAVGPTVVNPPDAEGNASVVAMAAAPELAIRFIACWNAVRDIPTEVLVDMSARLDRFMAAKAGRPVETKWDVKPGERVVVIVPVGWSMISHIGKDAPFEVMKAPGPDPWVGPIINTDRTDPMVVTIAPPEQAGALMAAPQGNA